MKANVPIFALQQCTCFKESDSFNSFFQLKKAWQLGACSTFKLLQFRCLVLFFLSFYIVATPIKAGDFFGNKKNNLSFSYSNNTDSEYNRSIIAANVAVAQSIVGVDKATSGTSGHFNITLDIIVQNIGSDNVSNFSLLEHFAAPDQLGTAFIGLVEEPLIMASTATTNPTLNPFYNGTDIHADLLNGDGLLAPNEVFTIRISIEINPNAVDAPDFLQMQSRLIALNVMNIALEDVSDSGITPLTTNPDQPGDTGGADDPTPVMDCWQELDDGLACNNTITTSLDPFCQVNLTADAILENHFSACDGMALFPLGAYYRLEVRDWTGALLEDLNPATASIYEVNGADYANTVLTVSVSEVVYGNSCWASLTIEDKSAPICLPALDEEVWINYDEDCDNLIEMAVNDPSGVDDLKDEYILSTLLGQNGVDIYFDILEAQPTDGNGDGDFNDVGYRYSS